jgi:osmotically-inducible protein OsmY
MSQENFDQDLETCIRELLRNSREDYSEVNVSVDAGNVHFTGSLRDEWAKKHLSELATMVQEIGTVSNEVTLKH